MCDLAVNHQFPVPSPSNRYYVGMPSSKSSVHPNVQPGSAVPTVFDTTTNETPHPEKLAEDVARRLHAKIVSLGSPVGMVVGSEPDLVAELGVSRGVFREAVRLLERDELARMRRGPGGGLVVTAPRPASVVRSAALHLGYVGATPMDVFEARAAIELSTVDLAAQRITEDGIAHLRASLERESARQTVEGHVGSHEIHLVIADLTGNPAMRLFLEVLAALTTERPPTDKTSAAAQQAEVRLAHTKIAEAVIAGDSAVARHRMLRHLEGIADYMRQQHRDETSPVNGRRSRR